MGTQDGLGGSAGQAGRAGSWVLGASSTTSKVPGGKAVPWESHQEAGAVVALAQFSLLWILRPAATSVSFPACFPENLNVFADKLYLSYLLIVYFHIKKNLQGCNLDVMFPKSHSGKISF